MRTGTDIVVLVDEHDNEIGTMAKHAAHENGGTLHRAFSVFLFDRDGRVLLQKRAVSKYHFGGLWTNACCSHPRVGETPADAARRRLVEEMGIEAEVRPATSFLYRAHDEETGLTEHEFDHVLTGVFGGTPDPNPDEVAGWRWATPGEIDAELAEAGEGYTPWFPIAWRALKDAGGVPRAGEDRSGLSPAVYDELRRIAAAYLRGERAGHTLQATALVNEAFVRLGDDGRWRDRAHFIATAARAMRRILVDHARARHALKRGGDAGRVTIVGDGMGAKADGSGGGAAGGETTSIDLLALDEALGRLETLHERQARIVELRFFGGFSVAETAELLGVSDRTVELDWSVARAWLRRELG